MSSDAFLRRYARHLVLPEIGESGQKKLADSFVCVVGCGGLGSVTAGYLAAMGVGKLRIVDADRVEISNLQRQILFEEADIGIAKTIATAQRIEELNSHITLETKQLRLDEKNAAELILSADVVIDATDNFASRINLHEACFKQKTPLIYAAISGFEAQITSFKGYLRGEPCLNCFMPQIPQRENSCAQEGIIGALAGVIGSMQALEAVKELLEIGESLSGKILRYNALFATVKISSLKRDLSCKKH